MSDASLKRLTIVCLRGSTGSFSLSFETGKKLTVLYGENATGKSTICDAFEFIGKGRIGSLDNRGLGRTESYWPAFGKKPTEVVVTLETGAGSCGAKLANSEVICEPTELRPKVGILRRSRILDLVAAQGAAKYKAIERFIDVRGPESAEGALRDLIKSLKHNQQIALARLAENQSAIEQSWVIDGKPEPDAFSWADAQSRVDTKILDTEAAQIESLIVAIGRLKDTVEAIQPATDAVAQAKEGIEKNKRDLRQAAQIATADASDVVAILESAQSYLHAHTGAAVCPLCESAEKIDGLGQRIETRLKSFNAFRVAQSVSKQAENALTRAEARLQAAADAALMRAADFEQVRSAAGWPADIVLPEPRPLDSISNLNTWLPSAESLVVQWKTARDRRADRKSFVATVKSALATYRQNFDEQEALNTLLPKLADALEIAETERHAFTDEMLSAISVDIGRLYEAVHVGEGLEKISLALDPKRRASLDIGSSFEGKTGLPPQAYLSESHLDTLGLCIFLALAALDDPEGTILVLDDVLASVDEPHVERLIEMLYEEAEKFRHCIITTHYRPWKHRLQWGWLKNGQVQFVELGRWSNVEGLSLIQAIPDVEKLRSFLAEIPPDVQTVCAKAGYILEAALNFLTLQYECPCPRKPDGRHTLRDYIQSISKKLRDALRVEGVKVDGSGNAIVIEREVKLGPIVNEIERIAEARNVFGCHFKELSFDLLDQDGLAFGYQVLALMDALTDQSAGWPSKQQTDHWTTGDKTRRLYPLRRP